MSIVLGNEATLYISTVSEDYTTKLRILPGFTLSQTTTEGNKPNGNKLTSTPKLLTGKFPNKLNPVKVSFTTYHKANSSTVKVYPEQLWKSLFGYLDSDTFASNKTVTPNNTNTLQDYTIFIELNGTNYKISNAVVTRAVVDFALDKITTITWELSALSYELDATIPSVDEDLTTLATFATNALNTITVDSSNKLAMINGRLSFNNSVKDLSRVKIGQITQPTGHYINGREVKGSFSCYLRNTNGTSLDVVQSILSDLTTTFDIKITTSNSTEFNIPTARLKLPKTDFKNAVTLDFELYSVGTLAGSLIDDIDITFNN